MTNYVNIYEEYRHKFFQLPKVFFTNEKYINLSNNSKIAWAILRDRSSLSRKNKWFDEDTGNVYFIYKNQELMNILNVKSETTLSKIKKELENAKLIEQQSLGFNRPNKMYLINPIIEDEDIYKIDDFENYNSELVESEKDEQSQEGQGTSFIGAPNNEVPYHQKVKSSNTELSNTDLKDIDTLDTKDTKKDYLNNVHNSNKNSKHEKQKKKEEYMKNAFFENTDKIPEELANVLNVFSETIEQAEEYYNSILIAKNKVEKETEKMIWLEEHPDLINKVKNAFVRSIRIIEKNKNTKNTIKNPKGYLYDAVFRVFDDEYRYISLESTNE